MNTQLAPETIEYGRVIAAALENAGGFSLVRRSERESSSRAEIEGLLESLGVWDLQPRASALDLEAAAVGCKAAGRYALPYPVSARLAANQNGTARAAAAVITGDTHRINHADGRDLAWSVCDVQGRSANVVKIGESLGGKLGTFVSPVTLNDWVAGGDPALILTLEAWCLLGMVDHAAELTCHYVRDRKQFGKPLAAFQAVQFRLAEVAVAVQSLEEIAKYTLWAISLRRPSELTDAVALRVAALEAADTVFRSAHQLHGAIGFCDETSVSWLSRYSQPLRRLPMGRSQTEALFVSLCEASILDGLFSGSTDDALLGPGRSLERWSA